MTYLVNDLFYTLQGEGHHAGRPAVFLRFAKCNLWTGREADRASAVCNFCDTEFTLVRHRFGTAEDVAVAVAETSNRVEKKSTPFTDGGDDRW